MEFRKNDIAKLDLAPFRLPSADAILPIPPLNVPGTFNYASVSISDLSCGLLFLVYNWWILGRMYQ